MVACGTAAPLLADDAYRQAKGGAPNTNITTTPMLNNLTSQQFITDAVTSGIKDVRLSEMAGQKTQNTDVREFANRMAKDHAALNVQLEALAAQRGLTIPSTNLFTLNDPNWNNSLVENPGTLKGEGAYALTTNLPVADYQTFHHLNALVGRDFDVAYVHDLITDHINAINEFEVASQSLPDPAVRKFASDTLPSLRDHFQMAQKLENELAGQSAQNEPAAP